MSDEEKKAIEYWKRDISLYHYNTQLASEHYAQIILNLIETQQKEIEELKNADLTTVYLNGFYDGEKKVKDKIKAKIEEYDEMINATYGDLTHYGDIRRDNCLEIKGVLQSLLEEE